MRSLPAKFLIPVVLLLAATPILAQPGFQRGPHPGPQGDPPQLGRMLDQLDLTADQREQIDGLMAQRHQATRELRQQIGERRRAVGQAVHAESFDETAIRDAVADVAMLEADLAVERARGLQEMLALLTPEQREQARSMIERHAELRGTGKRGPRKSRGPHDRQRGGRHAPRDLDN